MKRLGRHSARIVALSLFVQSALCACNESDENPSSTDRETDNDPDAGTDTGNTNLPPEMLEGVTEVLVIDDFEDGDEFNVTGGYWMTFDDRHDDGESEVWPNAHQDGPFESDTPGYGNTGYAAHMTGHTGDVLGYDYVSLMTNLGPDSFCPKAVPTDVDMNAYDGVQFMAKGTISGGTLVFKILHGQDGEEGNCDIGYPDTLTGWADYEMALQGNLEEDWSLFRIRFDAMTQPSWGTIEVDIQDVLTHAKNFIWQYQQGDGEVDIWVDNLTLFKADDTDTDTEPVAPDMAVHDPTPPKDAVLDSIEIDNSLQTLAMETLDRGYNITNWLEQDDFDNFDTYNEAFVEKLATNGFKALRLPIDLDRYIEDRDDYFDGKADFSIDPKLFTILDSFDEWTTNQGLSLTIDYHQYDGSMHLDDPLDVETAVLLWSAVAEHFKDNPREDLFFELLNEAEQSGNVSELPAATWTEAAEAMIDGIRASDENHVILFGDVAWYGITPLTKRTPFEDDRIIYVFHFYNPFIFTHQGASWANMARVHDLPYPYDPQRWSEYYDDLGFDEDVQDAWLLDLVQNYYRDGNKSALRNAVIPAKRWAVEHQVPVICNEFGAYDAKSQLEDRVNYYTDIVSVFEELEIPWQHWFMNMDAETGEMDKDLKAAFGL